MWVDKTHVRCWSSSNPSLVVTWCCPQDADIRDTHQWLDLLQNYDRNVRTDRRPHLSYLTAVLPEYVAQCSFSKNSTYIQRTLNQSDSVLLYKRYTWVIISRLNFIMNTNMIKCLDTEKFLIPRQVTKYLDNQGYPGLVETPCCEWSFAVSLS